MDLNDATEIAVNVRGLYHRLEQHNEGRPWEAKDDMLGLVNDVGITAAYESKLSDVEAHLQDVVERLEAG